ncbi:hypothetical protein GALMADRAFT_76235 [Galerina marginata CBS 339.88]|uniref:Uncharacterized protein n=1 Tax=Galerina marginata (strain CBS 339.88) TaxID=685588 RepID=A0A067SHQ8_GALM3|nr:hypothetical protein GALMADRAFT_76235 [Galerina marginata CBS 339.88]
MPQVPITEAHLIELFVESIMYGVHAVSAGYCIRTLLCTRNRWKTAHEISWAMFAVATTLLVNATFNVILQFHHTLKAFVFSTGPGGPLQSFLDISDWENIAKIYRCWVICDRSWLVIALPIFLWIGTFGAAVWVTFLEATLHSQVLLSGRQLKPAGTTFWALTTSLNIITTSLLVWRIWRVDRANMGVRVDHDFAGNRSPSALQRVIRIIVESGLMYTATACVIFVTDAVGSNALYPASGVEIQVTGVAFNLIIIRAARLSELKGTTRQSQHISWSTNLEFRHPTSIATRTTTATPQTLSIQDHEKSEAKMTPSEYSSDDLSNAERQ